MSRTPNTVEDTKYCRYVVMSCPPSDPYWTMTSISVTSVCKLVKHKESHTQHSTMQLATPCTVISELIGPHNELVALMQSSSVLPYLVILHCRSMQECRRIAILRDTLVLFFVWCWACWFESSPLTFTLPPITHILTLPALEQTHTSPLTHRPTTPFSPSHSHLTHSHPHTTYLFSPPHTHMYHTPS